ncbi:MAG: 16S rRNA processing protein RimM [Gemmatimonadetes bacterium]|jgi:16S rRNA processing protein RimM|nr:16S rRNA processing protein RimM [Gemmatimonadota bacterium]MEC8991882.1 ribosome maturation factor RimM [Candidatus Latescibacterota bacterium]MED5413604.1 ribosome maturation factor RimM [Candidatus Latescibacterota bacterium]MEE3042595.1 ribosome maturation factor RimM [Candidatus Latescibacterota bacterium]
MDERITIGYLTRTKGVRGWVVTEPLTDDPQRFEAVEDVVVEIDRREPIELKIEDWRLEGTIVLLKFAGIDTPEEARERVLKGYVTIPKDQLAPLPEGQHYVFDLIGCQVVDADDVDLGAVTQVLPMPSADVIVVRRPRGGEAMVPMVGDFVESVDTQARQIRVRGVEELFED